MNSDDICYLCESTSDLRSTGNSDGFVCATCISDPDNTNAFCVKCLRYEETDDFTLCGKCQSIDDSDDDDEDAEDQDPETDDSDEEDNTNTN